MIIFVFKINNVRAAKIRFHNPRKILPDVFLSVLLAALESKVPFEVHPFPILTLEVSKKIATIICRFLPFLYEQVLFPTLLFSLRKK